MLSSLSCSVALATLASPLFAHAEGHLATASATSSASLGFLHPLLGWDHLLAMVTVGVLGVTMADRHRYLLPGTFLGAFSVGALGAWAGLPLAGAEWAISGSVLLLGACLAYARTPKAVIYATVAMAALFHGHAHLAEMPAGSSLAAYGAGMFLATAFLHATGLLTGTALQRKAPAVSLRLIGGGIAACGAALLGLLALG